MAGNVRDTADYERSEEIAITAGRLALGSKPAFLNEWRQVYLDGQPLPYEGYQVAK